MYYSILEIYIYSVWECRLGGKGIVHLLMQIFCHGSKRLLCVLNNLNKLISYRVPRRLDESLLLPYLVTRCEHSGFVGVDGDGGNWPSVATPSSLPLIDSVFIGIIISHIVISYKH